MTSPPSAAASLAFSGVVLCGGESTRMGRDKALIEIEGVPMARRVADALRAAGAVEVIAVGGDATALRAAGLEVHPDDHPGAGPLGATITGLAAAARELVMVTSCDLLRPDAAAIAQTVRALQRRSDAQGAMPEVDGYSQWTHTAWRRSAEGPLRAAFERGVRSLHRAAGGLVLVRIVDLSPESFDDADEPGDLADS